jgi:hypothetical protein
LAKVHINAYDVVGTSYHWIWPGLFFCVSLVGISYNGVILVQLPRRSGKGWVDADAPVLSCVLVLAACKRRIAVIVQEWLRAAGPEVQTGQLCGSPGGEVQSWEVKDAKVYEVHSVP